MRKVAVLSQMCKGIEGCGICAYVCPKNLFCASEEMNEAGYLPAEIDDTSECTGCMSCMIYCPDFAIVVERDVEDGSEGRENTDE